MLEIGLYGHNVYIKEDDHKYSSSGEIPSSLVLVMQRQEILFLQNIMRKKRLPQGFWKDLVDGEKYIMWYQIGQTMTHIANACVWLELGTLPLLL